MAIKSSQSPSPSASAPVSDSIVVDHNDYVADPPIAYATSIQQADYHNNVYNSIPQHESTYETKNQGTSPASKTRTITKTTRVYTIPPPNGQAHPPPPPGAPPGGQWGRNNYIGEWTAGVTCIACLFFFWPAVFLLCCPFDERDAYLAPNGTMYDAAGRRIGDRHTRFVPSK